MTFLDSLGLDDLEAGPDLDFIAMNIIAAKRRLKKTTPATVDFATAIAGLSVNDTIIGSSSLTVTISDDDFVLMDSGFFDADKDGRIDPIDLNYPENSKLWWRLTQCNPRSYEQIEMVFMERAAVHMMAHRGPLKASRAKRTRAQFLKMLTSKVKGTPIIFVSHDLDVREIPEGSAVSGPVLSAGDSLAVGTAAPLHAIRSTVTTRATVGFTSSQVLSDLQSVGSLPKTLVISAGTNDTNLTTFRNNIRSIIGLPGVKQVFWVDISRPVLGGVTDSQLNTVLREEQNGHPNVLRIIGWKYAVTQGKATLGGDDIHPDAAGYEYRAKLINKALGHSAKLTVPARPTAADTKANKDQGITPDPGLKIKGVTASDAQLAQVERALQVASKLQAPDLAVLAMVCAGIGESSFTTVVNSLGYGGVFQGQVETGGHYFKKTDTEGEATYFLKGGKGYGGGGAIKQANDHPDKSPGMIAADTEVSYPSKALPTAAAAEKFYGAHEAEAKALIEAYGGGGFGGGGTYRKQFNFEVGTTDKPHENFWDAANRLAAEVKWPFFLDGQYAYFDPETTLIRQKPVATIERDDPAVVRWDCDWDQRQISTELRLDLICKPFQFRAGEVFKLVGFGPASSGSTVGLPGRWLIAEIDRPRGSLFSSFTLKQPTAPEPEPAAETGSRPGDPAAAGGDIQGSPKDIIDNVVLPIAREIGFAITANQVEVANAHHTHLGAQSDHAGPADLKWAADISDGVLTDKEKKLVKALCSKFDIPYAMPILASATHDGYRFQIIHGANFPPPTDDHRDHVHFGVKRV